MIRFVLILALIGLLFFAYKEWNPFGEEQSLKYKTYDDPSDFGVEIVKTVRTEDNLIVTLKNNSKKVYDKVVLEYDFMSRSGNI